MADHADHIHVGFTPLFGDNKKLGKQALAILKPGQWSDLIDRLGEIDNPVVPTKPSRPARLGERIAGVGGRGALGRVAPRTPRQRGFFGAVQLEFGFLLQAAGRPLPGGPCGRRGRRGGTRCSRPLGAPGGAAGAAARAARSSAPTPDTCGDPADIGEGVRRSMAEERACGSGRRGAPAAKSNT